MRTMRLEYRPAEVRVSDGRGAVKGARVFFPDGRSGEVIPPEGTDRSQWMGALEDCQPDGIEDREWADSLEECARAGARGESGMLEVELDETEIQILVSVRQVAE